ncbi:hypothetical protein [Candidatus Neptunochlamydia vexilliferae]|uniref:Uncharacterized protein n=1 Tax=Candidatus Neptunichlamydia vexilliferae TaxID=1651774 RepID=A0ABS0AXW4_9BACT|nr:hypothetical protein [Candidatus Neptunochlamydia vexilliferae]MBF5058973.1 hypothetical protein [Candidatus Neptunochlamydia vexilliferae]
MQKILGWRKNRVAPYEVFKTLAVTGGVPRYLEEVIPSQSAEENLHQLCFNSTSLSEFSMIFFPNGARSSSVWQK